MKRLAAALLLVCIQARAAPPSIEDFQRPPAFGAPVLSPDGRHVAAIVNPDGRTTSLAVIATARPAEAVPIKAFAEADIAEVHWLDDDHLAFTARARIDGEGWRVGAGLWTIHRDGSGLRQWVNPLGHGSKPGTPQAARMLDANWSLYAAPEAGPPGALILRHSVGDLQHRVIHVDLARLDLASSAQHALTDGAPGHITSWVLDASGRPVFAAGSNDRGGARIWWRQGDAPWAVWHESGDGDAKRWPLRLDRAGHLYLLVSEHGRWTLHRADSAAPDAPSVRLLAAPGHSIHPRLLLDGDSDELLGAQFEADVPQTAWLAPAMAEAQAEIDRRLPATANLIGCQRCLAAPTLLVTSLSDQHPPRYFLFQRDSHQLTPLAAARPWLPDGARRQLATVAARDGLPLPVVVTHPAVDGPAPTVLLVHGGPWLRGNHWAWQAEPQFYASRGYRVLEVDFRGSTGYGGRHFHAGDQQWGQAMQDDLDDTVAWAVRQGLTDPQRVCVIGNSYGGYAALMALSRAGQGQGQERGPGVACAVAGFAPTDLTKLSSRHWSDFNEETLLYTLPRRIGNDAQLTAQSPISLVDKLRGPLLLAYGERDQRVPLAHGSELRRALTEAGRPPEWVAYPGEGHGLYEWAHQQDYWRRIEAFLATHLAPRP
jgi:dipeptidyl aminopeptidase/acylaminoacyl peptidase